MGVVFAATHLELGHRVAIKLLRDEMAESPVIVERFLREARAVVGLRTEHVCRVSDVGRLDTGAPYIVMEMLEGVDLQRTVARSPLPLTTAVEYVLQACVALAEAHAAGIIHRDLKPANLFVTRRLDGGPLVKVLDFGIAKALTETGAHLTHQSAMGSPGYMSPEQIQSARDVDVRTDIWALGVTLYQLLSARLPFGGTNITEIAIAVATEPPAPLDVDPRLRVVIWKCLEKQP
ncbi:MAG TPA: serine/threonine-protein kinase, partial [Kofleriaceae bacterium]